METPYHIRSYHTADREGILRIFRLHVPEYFCADEEEDLVRYLNEEIEQYFVSEADGEIVASGGCNVLGDTGRLSWYIVHPGHQSKGLGRRLAQHSLSLLKHNPAVQKIEVRTSQLVYPFYGKLGFELTYTEDNYWGPGMHLYHMVLPDAEFERIP